MLLGMDDAFRVIIRRSEPLLAPETDDERSGIVPTVTVPTVIEEIRGQLFVFFGLLASKIGVAKLNQV